jgi:predicted kinase
MKESLQKILDKQFYEPIKYKDIPNKKLLIGFSSLPLAGRTTLADKIREKFQAVHFNKEIPRTIIYQNEKINNVQEIEDILDEYIEIVFDRLRNLPNGLVIVDASIDRNYDKYKEWAGKNGYGMYIIGLETDRNIIEERIRKDKDPETAKWFLAQTDRWENDNKNFNSQHKCDFYIRNNDEKESEELLIDLENHI